VPVTVGCSGAAADLSHGIPAQWREGRITLMPQCLAGLWVLVWRPSLRRPFPRVFQTKSNPETVLKSGAACSHPSPPRTLSCFWELKYDLLYGTLPITTNGLQTHCINNLQACLSSLKVSKSLQIQGFVGCVCATKGRTNPSASLRTQLTWVL